MKCDNCGAPKTNNKKQCEYCDGLYNGKTVKLTKIRGEGLRIDKMQVVAGLTL